MFTPEFAGRNECCANRAEFCSAHQCMAWRWEQITTAHPLWADAVKAKAADLDEKPPYAKSARWVTDNKASLGMVPVLGYCGLAGAPK